MDFLSIFNSLFDLNFDDRIKNLQLKIVGVFKMEKYKNALSFEKILPALDKENANKMVIQFNIPPEEINF